MKLSKADYGEYLAILLLMTVGIYLQFFPLTETENDLQSKKIFLKEQLCIRERGEKNKQKYITILDAGNSLKFELTGCALARTKIDNLLGLNKYDSLIIGIRKSKTFAEQFNGEIDVLYISSSKHGPLLTLEDYNSCENKSNTLTPFLILGVILILIFRIIDRYRANKVFDLAEKTDKPKL